LGVLNYLKKVFGQNGTNTYAAYLSDSQPIFTSFGNNIYLSDYVNNAIDRVASEISKIDIKSIVQGNNYLQVQNDDITRLFRFKPNPLQTTSDFLANVEWLRRKNGNAFIYPQYEMVTSATGQQFKRYTAFYPLKPINIYIGINSDGVVWEVKFDFEDGSSYSVPYSELIHLKWRRGQSTIIGGGDDYGCSNDYDVLRTIDALDKTIQGLPKSIEASLQVKGVFHTKGLLDKNKMDFTRDEFEKHIVSSSSGMIATDISGDFTPVEIKAPDIPEAAMKFLKAVIQEKYGISAAILSGDYNGEQHSAFYQTAIEDFINQFEQAMTACVFTQRELDVGHKIRCYYSKINYMDNAAKAEVATLAKDTGFMTLNEIADMYGLPPFPTGDRRLQSLNYMSIANVDAYQMAQSGANKTDTDNSTNNSTDTTGNGGNDDAL